MKGKIRAAAALAANILILLFEVIAMVLSIRQHGWGMLQFYTQDSNYFALAASAVFTVFALRRLVSGKVMPDWISVVRYMATCCLTLTFFVVLFVLIPMSGFNSAAPMLTQGSMLYHHLLCPVLSVVSFVFFESGKKQGKREMLLALLPTSAYAAAVIVLNITKTLHGPYPFLYVYEQPVWMSVVWVIVILGMALLFSWLLMLTKNRCARKNGED